MRTTFLIGISWCLMFAAPARGGDAKDATDAQFVGADDWFFLPYPENSNSSNGQIKLGKMQSERSEYPGAKCFWVGHENRQHSAKTFFKTRMATPQDLVLGRRVIHPLSEIKTANDKAEMSWGYHRITNLVDAPKGQLIVHGSTNPEVDVTSLRVIVGGEPDPTITMTGKEDVHHFHPEHWLVFTGTSEPDANDLEAKMALAIRPPAKPGDEGVFLMLESGAILTTKHAYRSRPATRAELKTGTRVALFPSGLDLPSRERAYREAWWIGPLTNVTPSFIKVGRSTVRAEVMRIIE